MHVGDGRGGEPIVDVRGNLSRAQILGVLGEHACGVERDVAVAQHRRDPVVERPVARHIRVPVVPAHELAGTETARQPDARDVELCITDGPGSEDDGVVVAFQVREGHVGAVVHVAEQPDVAALEHVPQRIDDPLDARVVRCDPVPHETVRRGQPLEEVDRDVELSVRFQQEVGGVDTGRTGTDDRHPQGCHDPTLSSSVRRGCERNG